MRHYVLNLGLVWRLVILLLSIILCWKLFRVISPSPMFWGLHLYFLSALLLVSFVIMLNNDLYYTASRTSGLISMFIFLALIRAILFDSFYDVFFVAMMTFGLYYLLLRIFYNVSEERFFLGVEFLMFLVLLINFSNIVDVNLLETGLYFYGQMPDYIGDMNPTMHRAQSFIPIFGLPSTVVRVSGVSGTPYASSALVAAIAIYFYVLNNYKIFYFAVFQMLLFSVVTSLMVLLGVLAYKNRRSPYIIFLGIMFFIFMIYIVDKRGGWLPEQYLIFKLWYSEGQLILASLFGEGKWNPSAHSELRAFDTFFSLGVVGVILFAAILVNYYRFFNGRRLFYYRNYYAAWLFMVVLMLSSVHYQAFFLYPNIIFVVVFISFYVSRFKAGTSEY